VKDPARISLAPCPSGQIARLRAELSVGDVLAQVLVRRGLGDPVAARAWLAADERHDPSEFRGIDTAVALVRRHLDAGSRITVHGDYDVDGVCSTAVLVRALRSLGAAEGSIDWYLPSRLEDGYGLNLRTVHRLAQRGTRLLITADCAVTAVEEVSAARAAGMDVLVTDHHSPRADGVLPDVPIVHPALCGYPCADLCATAVAAKLAEALGAVTVEEDADLVALATVADVVALRGENRRLVREGLVALARTTKPGLRALMRVAQVDPSRLDAQALGFRLAPRINAAGRLHRADAGLELMLTGDADRARQIAEELDAANSERRQVEQRMLFEAESQAAQQEGAVAIVVAAEGWHPGVAGIVASRLADRHGRPAVVIALDGERGTGSGRSIPAFDLLGAFNACTLDHGVVEITSPDGTVVRSDDPDVDRVLSDALGREVTLASSAPSDRHYESVYPDVEGVVPEQFLADNKTGDEADGTLTDIGLGLAEELERLEPFGHGNPGVALLVPAARLCDPRPMGEGKHVRFTVQSGGSRSRAVAFGARRLPVPVGEPADATFTLRRNDYNGTVEPQLVLRHAQASAPEPIEVVGEPTGWLAGALAAMDAPLPGEGPPIATPSRIPRQPVDDRRGRGIAGTIASLVATGEPTLVVCADGAIRLTGLAPLLGGFALASWHALEREPGLSPRYAHVIALDPPSSAAQLAGATVLAWGEPELHFALQIHERDNRLRDLLAALYRDLRAAGGAEGDRLEATLRGNHPQPRPSVLTGRALRVLEELGLVTIDRGRQALEVPPPTPTELERSPAFRVFEQQREDGARFLATAATAETVARAA